MLKSRNPVKALGFVASSYVQFSGGDRRVDRSSQDLILYEMLILADFCLPLCLNGFHLFQCSTGSPFHIIPETDPLCLCRMLSRHLYSQQTRAPQCGPVPKPCFWRMCTYSYTFWSSPERKQCQRCSIFLCVQLTKVEVINVSFGTTISLPS